MSDQANEQSLEERMVGILNAEELPDDEEPQEQTEVAEEESEEDIPEQRTLKLRRGEEEIEIPEDEAVELAQKGYDYTKKTQEVAEQRKQVEMYAQAIKAQENSLREQAELQQVFIKEMAKVESMTDQLSQYEGLDWNALSDNDPVQAQKLYFAYTQLQNKRTQAQQDLSGKYQQLQQNRAQQDEMRLSKAREELAQMFPDWNAEKATEIRTAGKSYGFNDNELSTITDPRMVKVLADAAAFRKLQNKGTITNKTANKPAVVKPGGKDAKLVVRSKDAETRSQLRKTGRDEYAAKLIEQML